MVFYRLFPKLRRGARGGTRSREASPTRDAEDLERTRHEIATVSAPLVCPVCQGKLAVRGPVELADGRRLRWMLTCLECEREEVRPVLRRRPVGQRELFVRLVESKRRGRRDVRGAVGGLFVSAAFQSAVVFAAVVGTMGVAVRVAPALDTIMLTLAEAAPEAEQVPDERHAPPRITTLAPPPLGFQVLEAPLDIPSGIPTVDLDQRFDPRDYSGRGVEGGVFVGVEGGLGPVDQPEIFLAETVEELPQQIYAPLPRYPSVLRRAGVEGYVDVRYIVLPDGTVDSTSVVVVRSSQPLFEEGAVRSVREARFRPGRMGGTPVRVLVEQRVMFTLNE